MKTVTGVVLKRLQLMFPEAETSSYGIRRGCSCWLRSVWIEMGMWMVMVEVGMVVPLVVSRELLTCECVCVCVSGLRWGCGW